MTLPEAAAAAVGGDPSSCSRLGGELRTHAASMVAAHDELVAAGARRGYAGPDALKVERDRRLVELLADRLDRAGSTLQAYGQELSAAADDHRRLALDVERAGLSLSGLKVVEPWGVADADVAAARRSAVVDLQARADRLAGMLARSRGAVRRALQESTEVLARASAQARASLGQG